MIRQPVLNLYTRNSTSTLSFSETFTLTKNTDYDVIVAKLVVSTISNITLPSAQAFNFYVQTSDDGGTTYYDNVAFGTVTNVAVGTASAFFATLPVNCGDGKYVGNITASAVSGYVGNVSGVPILSSLFRVVGNAANTTSTSTINYQLTLSAQNQAPHA